MRSPIQRHIDIRQTSSSTHSRYLDTMPVTLPPQIHVFVRDWLSSNNILLKSETGHVLIDSGYYLHAEHTLQLLRSKPGLGDAPLALCTRCAIRGRFDADGPAYAQGHVDVRLARPAPDAPGRSACLLRVDPCLRRHKSPLSWTGLWRVGRSVGERTRTRAGGAV
jgi:hypothetical protein